jgi:cell division protein FtsI/penicillin-binding protein 2
MAQPEWPGPGSKRRLMVLWMGTVVGVLILTGRLFYWQVIRHKDLKALGDQWQFVDKPIPALRGSIMDQRGFILAMDQYEFEIYATPRDIDDPDRLAAELGSLLDMDQGELAELLSQRNRDYVPLAREVPLEEARNVEEMGNRLHVAALGMDVDRHRVYLERELACHLLGFATGDNEVFYGVEEFYDDELRGIDGSWAGTGDVIGLQIGIGPTKVTLPQDGRDVVLTIDRTIQHIAAEELQRGIAEYGGESGTVIVMQPGTGAVLAMASYPGYDANLYHEEATRGEPFTDPAISETYEPGSVFKVITMAAALDSGIVDRQSFYNDTGQIAVGGTIIQNWDRKAYGPTSMTQLLKYSLNVGASTLSTNMGEATFYDYVQGFGFGEVTGIDLPYESPGILRLPGEGDWHESDLGTNAFGQGISVTPLQMIGAVAAVANDGVLPTPYVVQRIEQGGQVIKEFHPQPVRQAISASVARELTEMLVETLVGKENLSIPGYTVAGKTGTAQIPVPGGYHPEDTIASFVGYAPADAPRFIILVRVDKPRESPWGSVVAVPVFRRIAQRLFVYLDIPPDEVRMASR